MILANNGFSPEIIIVLVIVVLSVFANFISWLSKALAGKDSDDRSGRRDRAEGEGEPAPAQALKDFLQELTGQTEAQERRGRESAPAEPQDERWESPPPVPRQPVRPAQRPARPGQRPDRPMERPERPAPRQAEARRPTPRPAEYARAKPRQTPPKPRQTPPKPRPVATTPEEAVILEEADTAMSAGLGSATGGAGGGTEAAGMSGVACEALGGQQREARQDWIGKLPGNDIQNAILLMEILGPPRALKPHRPR